MHKNQMRQFQADERAYDREVHIHQALGL